MDSKTMKALMEHMAEQHRQTRDRNKKSGYEIIYVQNTNKTTQDQESRDLK